MLALPFVMACSRPSGEKSYLRIQAPNSQSLAKSGLNAFSNIPSNRKACYGVNVTASDITIESSACTPKMGIVAGFVEENEIIQVEVPRGTKRKIDLYLHLMPPGQSGPCPKLNTKLENIVISSTFLMGSAVDVDLNQDIQTVSIDMDFPGLSAHIGQQLALPSTCQGNSAPERRSGFHLSTSQGIATGGSIRMHGRIGRPTPGTTATGGSIKLNGKVY